MTTLADVLKGIRNVIVLNDRLAELSKKTDRYEGTQNDILQRLVRVETIIEFARTGMGQRTLPPPAAESEG